MADRQTRRPLRFTRRRRHEGVTAREIVDGIIERNAEPLAVRCDGVPLVGPVGAERHRPAGQCQNRADGIEVVGRRPASLVQIEDGPRAGSPVVGVIGIRVALRSEPEPAAIAGQADAPNAAAGAADFAGRPRPIPGDVPDRDFVIVAAGDGQMPLVRVEGQRLGVVSQRRPRGRAEFAAG